MKLFLWIFMLIGYVHASTLLLPENFKANFEQTITNTKKRVIHYSGKVYFSNKTLLKWAYLKPTQKEVCVNNLELLVVDHDLEQVSHYLIHKGFDLIKILKKAKLYKKNIYLASYEGKIYTMQVDAKGRLQSVAYFDDLDNKVQIIFKKVIYGKGKLPSNLLQCDYPKSYDMIRG